MDSIVIWWFLILGFVVLGRSQFSQSHKNISCNVAKINHERVATNISELDRSLLKAALTFRFRVLKAIKKRYAATFGILGKVSFFKRFIFEL